MTIINLKWTTSKARDTFGYNRLTGTAMGDKYVACGGGFDMIGSVLGSFIADHFQALLKDHAKDLERRAVSSQNTFPAHYGLYEKSDGSIYIDGACGEECVYAIAKAAGLEVERCVVNGTLKSVGVYL